MKTDSDINIGILKEFIEKLPSRDSRLYEIQSGFDVKKLAQLAREVVEKHDVRHIRTLHTRDGKTCEIWYYGRTKVAMDDIVIRISIPNESQTMELFAATRSAEALTGLLAEVGRDLKQVVEDKVRGRVVNVHIKDSLVQRSNLLDMCNMDGTCDVNVVIEGSLVQRSSIAAVDEEKALLRKEQEEQKEERIWDEKKENKKTDFINSIGMNFTLIPAGEFMMGSYEEGDQQPVHQVKISKSFYLGTYPVTQRDWKAIMGCNPSKFEHDDRPVEMVSWDDVQKFIKKLNAKEGTDKYRLPSEAEWEYACRAGTTTRYSFGDDASKLEEYAWYDDNSGKVTHPVGHKKPNQWGLYDMHGNVKEWVQDNWHYGYEGAPADGTAWENKGGFLSKISGSRKNRRGITRGGDCNESIKYCWSTSRNTHYPDDIYRYHNLGFRLLREM